MKIEIKQTETKTYEKIEVREPLVRDLIAAERVSGNTNGIKYVCALIGTICLFDGKKLMAEEIEEFPVEFFLELQRELEKSQLSLFAKQVSSSLGEDSNTES